VRFVGTCYRAHDPKWSFKPLSGEGAARRGGRFNPRGTPALYLSLSIMTAVKEANQGFAFKIQPCVLCCYAVDCEDIADLRTDAGRGEHDVGWEDMACAWFSFLADGREPPSWPMVRGLIEVGHAGALVPSFAPGATEGDDNLVLWRWDPALPHRVSVFDPSGRLPRNALSWE
jgi:RES domain-containing protein